MKSSCLGMAFPTWRLKEAEMKKLVSILGAFAVVLIGVPVFALSAAPVEPAGADPTYAPLCGSNEATAGTALSGNYKGGQRDCLCEHRGDPQRERQPDPGTGRLP